MASKKITDLSAQTGVTADDLIIIVDMAGPTTYKLTIANLCNSIPSNTNFTANVSVSGTLAANIASFVGNVSVDTATKYLVVNNFIVKKTTTPSSSTDTVTAADVGKIWTDGSYLYAQANATHYKRVAIATW